MRILGYSTQEIAALYGMRPNVVAAWVSRARQMTAGGSVHENRRRSLCAGFVKGKYYPVIGRFPAVSALSRSCSITSSAVTPPSAVYQTAG